jgi:hypothetical protein
MKPDPSGPADINEYERVDNADLSTLLGNWLQATMAGKDDGELNGDELVDVADFEIMGDWWGRGAARAADQPPLSNPEPAAVTLLATPLLGLLVSRRVACGRR